MTEITRQSVLALWEKSDFINPTKKKCAKCGNYDLVQHQDFCVECMVKNAKFNQKLKEESKGKCSMCWKKLTAKEQEIDPAIPYLKPNVCKKCLRNSF